MLDFKIEVSGIDKFIRDHDPKKVMLSMHSALNKVSQQARTHAARLIGDEFNIQKSRINEFLKITTRSSGQSFTAVISGKGLGLPLSLFGAKQVGVNINKKRKEFKYNRRAIRSGQLRRGGAVSVEVRRGSRKLVSGDPKPFMAILNSGHVAIFQRTGRGRLPVQQLYGPGVGGLFKSERINTGVVNLINEKFEPLFLADLKWRLEK
jgi:hypothetical protein